MEFVGYLQNKKDGLHGENGIYYNYIFAGNGVFLHAATNHIDATICTTPTEIRGLKPLEEKVTLLHGLIPGYLYELAFSTIMLNPDREQFLAITYDKGYHIKFPKQKGLSDNVIYITSPNTVLDIHSHADIPACFSPEDNKDEQGFKLSLVIGKIAEAPEYMIRIGVYGYFHALSFEEVFSNV